MNQKETIDLVLLKFIDAYVDLYGSINTNVICEQFNTHRTRASDALKLYREHENGKPSNLKFNVSSKKYDKGVLFEKVFLQSSSWEFLQAIYLVFGESDK